MEPMQQKVTSFIVSNMYYNIILRTYVFTFSCCQHLEQYW